MSKISTIFVDSDAFIALVKLDDSNHKRAEKIFKSLQNTQVIFITSNYVFSEVVTVLSQRVSHKVSVDFINSIKSEDNIFQIERISEQIEDQAIQIFIEQPSKNISFVDCTNMAFIKKNYISAIFSFDDVYKKNGVPLI